MGDPAGEQGVEEERARRAEARAVTYHPVSGVPEEFHDFLHKDCDEYKRLKAAAASGAPADAAADQLSAASLEVHRTARLSLPAHAQRVDVSVAPARTSTREGRIMFEAGSSHRPRLRGWPARRSGGLANAGGSTVRWRTRSTVGGSTVAGPRSP